MLAAAQHIEIDLYGLLALTGKGHADWRASAMLRFLAPRWGCQGEVGVACSMAAAGLTAAFGSSNAQIENAAEIGMEHDWG